MRGEFQFVGKPMDNSDIALSYDAATELRDYVAQNFFDNVPLTTKYLDEFSDVTLFGKSFHGALPTAEFVQDTSIFDAVKLSHFSHTWRLMVMKARTRSANAELGHRRTQARYVIEAGFDDEVIDAVKQVWVVREIGHYGLLENLPSANDGRQVERKQFERPLTHDDCEDIRTTLGNTVSRIGVTHIR